MKPRLSRIAVLATVGLTVMLVLSVRPSVAFLHGGVEHGLPWSGIEGRGAPGSTSRVSVRTGGFQSQGGSWRPTISRDGRHVAFAAVATDLVTNDSRVFIDIYVHDRKMVTTTRVSVSSEGVPGNGDSEFSEISGDGRFVAFTSDANNLVVGDTNGAWDAFVHDRVTATTTRVSIASDGSEWRGGAGFPTISSDGRYVAFASSGSNLRCGLGLQIFVRDRVEGTTTCVSRGVRGAAANSHALDPEIAGDGRFVVFESRASNLVRGDTNAASDIFVRDLRTGTTSRVSLAPDGSQRGEDSHNPSLSDDGQVVAFDSFDMIVVYDRQRDETTVVGHGDLQYSPSISSDGRSVVFSSAFDNVVPNDPHLCWDIDKSGDKYYFNCTDVFIHDRETGQTAMVSVAPDGTPGNWHSGDGLAEVAISADGGSVVFDSIASNLVGDDTNGNTDVFVRDLVDRGFPIPRLDPLYLPHLHRSPEAR